MADPVNDFLPFATADDANVESQVEYLADPSREAGYSLGKAESKKLNKVWRQSAFVASALAQLILERLDVDVLDNGDLTTFVEQLSAALAVPSGVLPIANGGTGGDTATSARTSLGAAGLADANVFTNQQAVTPYRASVTGDVVIDLEDAKSNNLHLTLTSNVSSFSLTNPVDGAVYNIRLIQDATGGHTFALPAEWKFSDGIKPTLATTPNAVNFISLEWGEVEGTYMAAGGVGMS